MASSDLMEKVFGADKTTEFLYKSCDSAAIVGIGLAEAASPFVREPSEPLDPETPFGGGANALAAALLAAEPDRLRDSQLVELLAYLASGEPELRLGDRLMERFGSLGAILSADRRALEREFGLAPEVVTIFKTVRHTLERVLREPLRERPIIGSMKSLRDYLGVAMANEPLEQVRILFLDRKNFLISDEIVARGTIDHTPLYPREVLKRCIDNGAAAVVMVHNHPSGDPEPSRLDVEMTAQLDRALRTLDIVFHDHVVIGKRRHVSFRERGLLN